MGESDPFDTGIAALDTSAKDMSVHDLSNTIDPDIADMSSSDGMNADVSKPEAIAFQSGDVIETKDETVLREIANELQSWVDRTTHIKLEVKTSAPNNVRKIVLKVGCELPRDGFETFSPDDHQIVICGSHFNGVRYGVYHVIERDLGVRWLFPERKTILGYIFHRAKLS